MVCTVLVLLAPPNAAVLRGRADALLDGGKFQAASEAYAAAARAYRRLGDDDAGQVLDERARRWATEIRFFVRRPAPDDGRPLARFEPPAGMYAGVNIEREDATRDPQAFNNLVQKHHALFFRYRAYGVEFPKKEAAYLKRAKSGLQIAFEPRRLADVRDDAYLRKFAEDCRDSGIPIFLRFASEMNGSWTPYHGDPEAYVAAFRTVARVTREIAPNVAMVWCPNEIPRKGVDRYYPGADAVDWVGVNFYSVFYNDADRAREARWRWPLDAFDWIYRAYSARHPIMIGEWAATHRSSVDDVRRPEFAVEKIRQFYRSAPLLYPRLKAASWLSYNALKYAKPGRQLNDYSLYDEDAVAEAYGAELRKPWFPDRIGETDTTRFVLLTDGDRVEPGETVYAWWRSYDAGSRLRLRGAGLPPDGPETVTREFPAPPDGRWTAEVVDASGRPAGRAAFAGRG